MEVLLGLFFVALALFLGLTEIATAIRYRKVEVNVGGLPPIFVNTVHRQEQRSDIAREEKP